MFKVAMMMVAIGLLLALPPLGNSSPHLTTLNPSPPLGTTLTPRSPTGLDSKSFFSPKEAEVVRQAWEINRQQGPQAAVDSLLKAKSLPVILVRAAFKEKSGDLPGAMSDYKRILDSKNMTEPRALALDGYQRVLKLRINKGEKNLYQLMVQVLKDEWLNETALKLIPQILADPDIAANVKDFVRQQKPIMALRLGRYQEAARLWAGSPNKADIQWLSQAENRQGNFVQAARLREELAQKSSPGRKQNRELGVAFSFLTKGGQYDQALALATKHHTLQSQTDYQWWLGVAAMAAGNLGAAETHFKTILENPKLKKRHPGAKYFLARLHGINGQKDQALALYQELAQGPFNYYHILAQGRLNAKEISEVGINTRLSQLLDSGSSGQDYDSPGYQLWITEKGLTPKEMEDTAKALIAMGPALFPKNKKLAEEVISLLKTRNWEALATLTVDHEQAPKHLNPEIKDMGERLLASATARSGNYRHSTRLFSRIPGDGSPGLKGWSHPLIYGQEIRQAHRDLAIPPALLLAVIRTESAFQANIMSRSNARGLMQLLPATANKVGTALGGKTLGPLDLFQPGLNVRYGSWYLKKLMEGFGNVHLALAGYNGGPYNIKNLIAAKPGMPLDIFVESLPFEETANYVKRIVESRFVYESVYLNEATLPDLTMPVRPPNQSLPTF